MPFHRIEGDDQLLGYLPVAHSFTEAVKDILLSWGERIRSGQLLFFMAGHWVMIPDPYSIPSLFPSWGGW